MTKNKKKKRPDLEIKENNTLEKDWREEKKTETNKKINK